MPLNSLSLWTLAVLSMFVALLSWRFLFLGLDNTFVGAPFDAFLQNDRAFFVAHVITSPIALAIGALQFFPTFRNRSISRHRWVGRIYSLSILVGGLSAIFLTFSAWNRPMAASGFFLLGVFWLLSTGYAIHLARSKRIEQHRDWMNRSFALTASALTLRLYLGAFFVAGCDYHEVSSILAWLAWVPNLVVAEVIIARRANTAANANAR